MDSSGMVTDGDTGSRESLSDLTEVNMEERQCIEQLVSTIRIKKERFDEALALESMSKEYISNGYKDTRDSEYASIEATMKEICFLTTEDMSCVFDQSVLLLGENGSNNCDIDYDTNTCEHTTIGGLCTQKPHKKAFLEQKINMKTEDETENSVPKSHVDGTYIGSDGEENVNIRHDYHDHASLEFGEHSRSVEKQNAINDTSRRCEYCHKIFKSVPWLKLHVKRVCKATRCYDCPVCPKQFKVRGNLDLHMSVHSTGKHFFCELCGKSFKWKKGLTQHIKLSHLTEQDIFKCDWCDYTSNQSATLKRHLLVHTGERPFNCDLCGKSFAEKKTLIKHICMHTGQVFKPKNRLTCDTCGTQLTGISALRSHFVKQHTGSRELFPCKICNKQLLTKRGLESHMETHGDERHECPTCLKVFSSERYLDKHAKRHAQPRVQCHLCQIWCTNESGMRKHLKGHVVKENQDYKCHICHFCSDTRFRLTRHISNKHRDFNCLMCSAVFNDRNKLEEHKRRKHLLTCDYCEYRCNDSQRMEYHVNVKHALFTCEMCGKIIRGKYVFNEHLSQVHKSYEHRSEQRFSVKT